MSLQRKEKAMNNQKIIQICKNKFKACFPVRIDGRERDKTSELSNLIKISNKVIKTLVISVNHLQIIGNSERSRQSKCPLLNQFFIFSHAYDLNIIQSLATERTPSVQLQSINA